MYMYLSHNQPPLCGVSGVAMVVLVQDKVSKVIPLKKKVFDRFFFNFPNIFCFKRLNKKDRSLTCLFNPVTPMISFIILLTVCHTVLDVRLENLVWNQLIIP